MSDLYDAAKRRPLTAIERRVLAAQAQIAAQARGEIVGPDPLPSDDSHGVNDSDIEERYEIGPMPAPLGSVAMYGLAGDFVRLVEPETESDPAGLLVQFLVAAGCLAGRRRHFLVGATRHYPNLFALCVGPTSAGRKGMSWDCVEQVVLAAEPSFVRNFGNGLSSGEGVIYVVRDPAEPRPSGRNGEKDGDPGVPDKRFCVFESEFGQPLGVMIREGNTLSPTLRNAWDGRRLRTMTKNSPLAATDPHISIVGHITGTELRRRLPDLEITNGFANRFAFCVVRQSKLLPDGGNVDQRGIAQIGGRLADALRALGGPDRPVFRTDGATALWREWYEVLTNGVPGPVEQLMSRAAPIVMRLALVYAILDQSSTIDVQHLTAAHEVWRYCADSAVYLFGDRFASKVAERVLATIDGSGDDGVFTTAIHEALSRNKSRAEISSALAELEARGLIVRELVPTGRPGRPATLWRRTRKTNKTKKVESNSFISFDSSPHPSTNGPHTEYEDL